MYRSPLGGSGGGGSSSRRTGKRAEIHISEKGKSLRGISRWDIFDSFNSAMHSVPNGTFVKLMQLPDLGARRKILVDLGIPGAEHVPGKFLNQTIEATIISRNIQVAAPETNNRLRHGGNGRFLLAHVSDNFPFILKTYYDDRSKKKVLIEWIGEGFGVAKRFLGGLAAPTYVMVGPKREKRKFAFVNERGRVEKTDIAIIQTKIVPFMEHLTVLVRQKRIREAKKKLDDFKRCVIEMFKRGVVDKDFGGILGNYGVEESTGKVFIFDFGDLSAYPQHGVNFRESLDVATNKVIIDGLAMVDDGLAEYYRKNPLEQSDFEAKGRELFGSAIIGSSGDRFKMTFPLTEAALKKFFIPDPALVTEQEDEIVTNPRFKF